MLPISQIDIKKLFAIAYQLVSAATVQDVSDLIATINAAVAIVNAAALRIAGLENDGDRALESPEQAERINQAIVQYYEA